MHDPTALATEPPRDEHDSPPVKKVDAQEVTDALAISHMTDREIQEEQLRELRKISAAFEVIASGIEQFEQQLDSSPLLKMMGGFLGGGK